MEVKTTAEAKVSCNSLKGVCASLAAVMLCMSTSAGDLTIDGGNATTWDGETKEYGSLYIGSVNGSGSLLAIDSTINLSSYVYFGYQNTADDIMYSSSLVLTNTSFACDTFSLGYCVKGGAGSRDGRSGRPRSRNGKL